MDKSIILDTQSQSDERGWVNEPIENKDLAAGKIRNVHIASILPGAVRGNHFHMRKTEFALIMGNGCQFNTIDNETSKKEQIITDGSKPVIVRIPQKISHAFKNIGNSVVYLLCYSDQPFDPKNPDLVINKIL